MALAAVIRGMGVAPTVMSVVRALRAEERRRSPALARPRRQLEEGGNPMTLFGQQARKEEPVPSPEPRVESLLEQPPVSTPPAPTPLRSVESGRAAALAHKGAESIVAAGLTIEGKIEGSGNVRVAGRFK